MTLTIRLIAFLALAFATGVVPASDIVERGRYLTLAGDCASCHTTRGGAPFSGGRVIGTPFGAIPAPNLTPDRDTGLGAWSADDFYRAMHNGKGHDDRSLYPVFPFTSYTKVTRADTDAIFAYLKSLPPVKRASIEPILRWPYSMRSLIASWRLFPAAPAEFSITAATVSDLIDLLDARWPGMGDRLRDSSPAVRRHINIFVEGERATLRTRLHQGAEVFIMTAISGG